MHLRSVEPILALSSLLLLVTACSNPPANATGGTAGSSGAGGSTSTSSGTGSSIDAGGVLTPYKTSIGPITLAPGVEETNCITLRLGNAAGGYVRRFVANLSEGSHHMIVYQSTDTTESLTPTPCQALGGILMGQHPVFIAQQPLAELDFPTDDTGTPVGFEIQPNQMLRIEFHTINTTQAPLMVTGTAYLDTLPLTAKVTPSDMAFWGTQKITIPPGPSSFDTGVLFQAAIPGTKSFAVTTHQHHLGTEMKVWYGTGATDTTDLVADGTSWANPELVTLDPALDFPSGAGKGFAFQCHWIQPSPTTAAVTFGESFNDEMCFLWHYYYPSMGFQVCLDGKCP